MPGSQSRIPGLSNPGQVSIDELQRIVRQLQPTTADTLPAAGDWFGQEIYASDTGKWNKWNGSSWDQLN